MLDFGRIQEFFLEAAAACWVEGVGKTILPQLHDMGAKMYTYPVEGPTWDGLRYIDCYWVGKTNFPWGPETKYVLTKIGGFVEKELTPGKSQGWTLITRSDIPIWMMSYGGEYAEEAIAFLKKALGEAYEVRKEFIAGRGPEHYEDDSFLYHNKPEMNQFTQFSTLEAVYLKAERGALVGTHWCRGGALV